MNYTARIEKCRQKWANLEKKAAPGSIEQLAYDIIGRYANSTSGRTAEEQERDLATNLRQLWATTRDQTAKEIVKQCANEFICTLPFDFDMIQ